MYENYGCEFLDLETAAPVAKSIDEDIIMLPIEVVRKMVDTRYLSEIVVKDREYLSVLSADISRRGLLKPGIVVVDAVSMKLKDGNHRFIVCSSLGHDYFPVTIEYSDGRIKSGGVVFQEIIKELLKLFK